MFGVEGKPCSGFCQETAVLGVGLLWLWNRVQPAVDFLFVKKKSMGPQQQGGPLEKQSSCSQEGWKQQRLLQGLLIEFEGSVEGLKVCQKASMLLAGLYICRSP